MMLGEARRSKVNEENLISVPQSGSLRGLVVFFGRSGGKRCEWSRCL